MSDFDDKATVTGAIASFNNGADEVPVDSGTFYIAPSQSGTGTPSPSNPRPIVGYTGMTIQHTGKNLLNYADITDSYKITSITDNGNGSFTVVGSNNGAWIQHIVPVKAGQAYSIKCASATNDEGNASQIGVVDVWDGTDTTATKLLDGASITSRKGFTPTGNYVLVRNRVTGGSGAGTGTINQPQLEIGTTATSFEAYKAKTPIVDAFGRTIYGGERKTDGTLTENYAYIEFDGSSDESWGNYSNFNGFYINIADMKQGTRQDGVCNMLSRSTSTAQGQTNAFWMGAGNKNFYILGVYDSMGNTLEAFKAYLSEHPITLVYPLATPNEYSLSPISLSTYYGDNNMWCDTGDTELTYYKFGYGYTSVTVNRTGKNLINDTSFISGLPSTTIGASIDTITASTRYAYLNLPTGGATITISSRSDDTDLFNSILIYGYKNGALYQYTNASPGTSKTVDFSACDYIRLAIGARTAQYQVPLDLTGYGYLQAEVGNYASDYEPYSGVSKTAKLHRIIYEGEVDVISGTGSISIGESGTEYDPPQEFTFPPISIETVEGTNVLYANEGDSTITYRKSAD